ncbi:peptidase [Marinilongibacter aquaticus]|uniref:peptidase n=1 Tax=Marinilongibacter aquaticus TaxID=2975157 RepID=UPI0021BD09FC|nr:peptidase [Marinilongibacter aquaticus]UBM58160.1 peptidase [Marinilongibacter aquaticus]
MTYCLGIRLKKGLVAIADTRITSGSETTSAKKVFVHKYGKYPLFIMTSGLRSVRDKVITYFQELVDENENFDKMYKAVNAIGDLIKRVANEDHDALRRSGINFNLFTIVGGQMEKDKEPKLYLLYPEGNWIEVGEGTPFIIIGNSGYGKPVLQRTVTYNSSLEYALKTGFLSFDSTRVSANDVGYPIDVLIFNSETFELEEHRLQEEDLKEITTFWADRLRESVNHIPDDLVDRILKKSPLFDLN